MRARSAARAISGPVAGPRPTDAAGPPLEVCWLGRVPYEDAVRLQQERVAARRRGRIPDQLLLLEHPHVITLGTSSRSEHVLLDEDQRRLLGITVHAAGRGGDVTYHGPGQLVGYPILDLKPDRCDVHRYLRDVEEALVLALRDLGVDAARMPGLTGVWVGAEKIAAIGVRVSSGWITSHGFALNVDPDLRYFGAIVPCGIRDHGVTSLARVLPEPPTLHAVGERVAARFAEVFGRHIGTSA